MENAPAEKEILPGRMPAGRTESTTGGLTAAEYRQLICRETEEAIRDEEKRKERMARAERSLIVKYRRVIWRKFTKAIHDYELIKEGDRIACCISGGKDSMILAKLLQEIQRHGMVKFDLVFLCMNPGYHEENRQIIENNAKLLGIDLTMFETRIFDAVVKIEQSPCYLCARMRRGNLYAEAKKLGCNKIALGHHFDDVIETVMLGMLYAGKFETMLPKLRSKNFEGMELIRPLYLVREADIKAWRDYNGLHFIQCACRFTENSLKENNSKRAEVKELLAALRKVDRNIDNNIFNSTRDVSLTTILGYHTREEKYYFLDDYDQPAKGEGDGI